jgi:hypothetical protein
MVNGPKKNHPTVNPWPRPDFKKLDLREMLLNSQELLSLITAIAPGQA